MRWLRRPGTAAATATEIAASLLVSTRSQSVNRYWTRGSLRGGTCPSGLPTRKQLVEEPGAHWYRPARVLAIATSAAPPRAPPGTMTSQDPSAAIVTVTVRAARPFETREYAAT